MVSCKFPFIPDLNPKILLKITPKPDPNLRNKIVKPNHTERKKIRQLETQPQPDTFQPESVPNPNYLNPKSEKKFNPHFYTII